MSGLCSFYFQKKHSFNCVSFNFTEHPSPSSSRASAREAVGHRLLVAVGLLEKLVARAPVARMLVVPFVSFPGLQIRNPVEFEEIKSSEVICLSNVCCFV